MRLLSLCLDGCDAVGRVYLLAQSVGPLGYECINENASAASSMLLLETKSLNYQSIRSPLEKRKPPPALVRLCLGIISKHLEDVFDGLEVLTTFSPDIKEEHPKCCQAKGSKDEEKLVHLKMVVKFEVLIEKKKMCSLGLMRFDWWMWFFDGAFGGVGDEEVVVREEEEALVEFMVEWFEEDEDSKKNDKDGLFNLKAYDQGRKA
ncbi:hypothetical protein Tco_0767187 [Tanacetum coccineum]